MYYAPPSSTTQVQQPTSFLIVSYTRKVIGQTGTGHFSPIGAYDESSDHVLVLDTARFKYGPHWIPLALMFEALLPLDLDTGKSRGYMVLSYDNGLNGTTGVGNDKSHQLSHLPMSVLFGSKKSKDFIRREYKQYLQGLGDGDRRSLSLSSIVKFWTRGHSNDNYVWELVEPQLQPVVSDDIRMVNSIRDLLQSLIQGDIYATNSVIPDEMLHTSNHTELGDCSRGECCNGSIRNPNSVRMLEISPAEVLYVVYLASLPKDARHDIVYNDRCDVDDVVRDQLLAEAALISYAIETCDAEI